ncbi:type II toxin-antitoxin system RelE/ParE family toxin [Inquilinus sp. Marseille-Q2685]|uniref:type II toxin-antitoxin system RelE/ParE family toxin n=1 Tax=Inquilinus sp. Marseille-Q2685 TaxID=2866581 RepID=UPI001CE434BD|nr:type II toxin-antitoxin system RelE/ParE family toxin [Inquilinus sp. Marseille-Q2685]
MAYGAVGGRPESHRHGHRHAEFCWPVGMPKCSSIRGIKGLYEIRSHISSGRIARVFFVLVGNQMVLLHGFIKKTQKTPDKELKVAAIRMKEVQRYED